MATTAKSAGLQNYIKGMQQAKAAFQALPEIVRDQLNVAVETTVREIARLAQAQILASPSIETRSLYNSIGWAMNHKMGRGSAGVRNITTTFVIGGKNVKVKGNIIAGRNGSALTSEGAKKINPRRYAHLVEFGSRHMDSEPFMMPAAEKETQPFLQRCMSAKKGIEHDVSAIGMRTI